MSTLINVANKIITAMTLIIKSFILKSQKSSITKLMELKLDMEIFLRLYNFKSLSSINGSSVYKDLINKVKSLIL
jgi:hypothetical protein